RIARMPTGIETESCCTTAELRNLPRAAKGTARNDRVIEKTIARTPTTYGVLGTGCRLTDSPGGQGVASHKQSHEQQQCGEQGGVRSQNQSGGNACRRQQHRG